MGHPAHVRVEAKPMPANASQDQKDRAFKAMFAHFKREVNDLGVLTEYGLKSTFESRGQKLRRKKKERELRMAKEGQLQSRLREHFGQG
jgi:ribosomal protein S21